MNEADGPGVETRPEPRSLEAIVAALRRLALDALNAGEPLAAARIAATADRIDAEAWPESPPRPGYRRPR
jgi:hypothetical protein